MFSPFSGKKQGPQETPKTPKIVYRERIRTAGLLLKKGLLLLK